MPLASWESSSETLAFLVYVRGPLLAPTILPACPSSVGHIAGILYRLVILQMYSLCLLRWFSGLSIWCGFFFFSNFWLCWVFAAHRLSLTAMSRSCSLVVVPGLLIAVASLVAEHRLSSVAHRLGWPKACGILPDQGWNLCPQHRQAVMDFCEGSVPPHCSYLICGEGQASHRQ